MHERTAAAEHDGSVHVEAPPPSRIKRRDRNGSGTAATFSDLVRAHWAWEMDFNRSGDRAAAPRLKSAYDATREAFEKRFGAVVDDYYSIHERSGVALTIGTTESRVPALREPVPRFHRATEWATREEPAIAALLDDCDTLAVKACEVLRRTPELIALRRIYAVAAQLLGFVDRWWGRRDMPNVQQPLSDDDKARHDTELEGLLVRQRAELSRIEMFYRRAGDKQARVVFFWGMARGLAALLPVTAAVVALIWAVDGLDGSRGGHWDEIQQLVVSLFAGAFGAILSVLTRMAALVGKFDLDYEVGRKEVRWLGVYRPFVGAIFGLASFFLLASGLVQVVAEGGSTFAYYGAVAFFSGFFERFMKIAPGGVPTPLAEEKEARKADLEE